MKRDSSSDYMSVAESRAQRAVRIAESMLGDGTKDTDERRNPHRPPSGPEIPAPPKVPEPSAPSGPPERPVPPGDPRIPRPPAPPKGP